MSKIDELIKEKCPDGVEYKPLWKLTTWDKKFNAVDNSKQPKVLKYHYYLANNLKSLIKEGGDIKILTTNKSNLFTTKDLVEPGTIANQEIIAIPWGGNPIIQYYKGKFVTADNRITISNNTSILDTKFLYYVLINKLDEISSFYRGSGIKHPNMAKILDMSIPVPPLEIQQEIVSVLNSFTELEAELEARKKQYEHYRDQLLSFEKLSAEGGQVEWLPLRELAEFRNGKGHEKDIVPNGQYVVVNSKYISTDGEVVKYTNTQICPLFKNDICLVMSDLPNGKALAKCRLIDENDKYSLNQRIGAFVNKDDEKLINKYLFYILNRNPQLLRYDNGTDQTNLKKDEILNISIPVPTKEIQERIVYVLDNFDAVCNDLKIGLPAEIEARQKQYEYYRNKLLCFNSVSGIGIERERED